MCHNLCFQKSAIIMFSYSLTTSSAMNFEKIHGNSTSVPPSNSGHKRKVTGIRIVVVCVTQTVIYSFTLTYNQIIRSVPDTTMLLFLFTTVFVYWKIFFTMRAKNRFGTTSNDIYSSQSNKSKIASEKQKKTTMHSF